MSSKDKNDVKTRDETGFFEGTFLGKTKMSAEQGGVTGRGSSFKPGQEGKIEATRKAAEEIAAKKAANK